MPEEKKIWFLIRGTTSRPCCWQGWAVLLISVALLFALHFEVVPEHYTPYALLLTAGLIGISFFKSSRHR